jgi:hypothetical protein
MISTAQDILLEIPQAYGEILMEWKARQVV